MEVDYLIIIIKTEHSILSFRTKPFYEIFNALLIPHSFFGLGFPKNFTLILGFTIRVRSYNLRSIHSAC
jgi:hypothetical protein